MFVNRVRFAGPMRTAVGKVGIRREFIGRTGSMVNPDALRRSRLAGRDGAGLDPCAAIQTTIELAPGEAREIIFLLGQSESKDKARELVQRYRQAGLVNQAFDAVLNHWDNLLNTVQVRT